MSEIKRNPYRIITCSSYDRGLVHLLNIWGEIKKAVPLAELHIFYGWDLFLKIHANNPARMKWKYHMEELMKQDGVTEHGRIGHKQLSEEFQKSGIWVYYCTFQEISCISAMKAQIYGAIPVVTNYAALEETVRNGIRIEGDPEAPETMKAYRDALMDLLKHPEKQEELRPTMMKWAQQKFPWSLVARQWEEEFKRGLNPQQAIIEGEVIQRTQKINTKTLKVVIPEGGVE